MKWNSDMVGIDLKRDPSVFIHHQEYTIVEKIGTNIVIY